MMPNNVIWCHMMMIMGPYDDDDDITGEWTRVAICYKHGWQWADDGNQQGAGDCDHHHSNTIDFLNYFRVYSVNSLKWFKKSTLITSLLSVTTIMMILWPFWLNWLLNWSSTITTIIPQGSTPDWNPPTWGLYREQCSSRYWQGLSLIQPNPIKI